MTKDKIVSCIVSEINYNDQTSLNKEIFKNKNANHKNEFLLILKPEIFIQNDKDQLKEIVEKVHSKLEQFDLQINSVRIQNAAYLRKYKVIDQHYGVINATSRDLKQYITEEAIRNFKLTYGISIVEAPVFGSLELLQAGQINTNTLSNLWKNCEIKRLGGGIYCGKVIHQNKDLYIVNGFHPPQLEHFIAENRLIITMNISGNCDWKVARKDLIGNTYPEKAGVNTIRGELYNAYGNFGFENVSYVINGIHLSAGPLEGLVELVRFNSSFEKAKKADMTNFSFGKLLAQNFSIKECEFILSNPTVKSNGKSISLFDLTEELNSSVAIKILKKLEFVNQ